MDLDFFKENSFKISKIITQSYSTSFSLATSLMERERKEAIYAIYAFVRLADEIDDSYHGYYQAFLLDKLDQDLDYALEHQMSTNTVLLAFACVVKRYAINRAYINAFMDSMRYDLNPTTYKSDNELKNYIYGSAYVVGLMCLQVFCDKDEVLFHQLKEPAQKLGSAFQKVNFLRDLREDLNDLDRSYFPEISNSDFNLESKRKIEQSITLDFTEAYTGLKALPGRSKLAVALAYTYYYSLFKKIQKASPELLLTQRVRISNARKYLIIISTCIKYKLRRI